MRSIPSPQDRTTSASPELLLRVDRGSRQPARQQVEDGIRAAVRAGRLAAGTRLPSTRALAGDLGVARGVVVEAYGQLAAEGYLLPRRGAGTVVASVCARADAEARTVTRPEPARPAAPRLRYDFRPGIPDLSLFPRSTWLRATRAGLARLPDAALSYGDPRGLPALRVALADYLGRVRGVVADPDRIVLTSGFAQALSLVVRVLAAAGSGRVAVEDPGGPGQRQVVAYAGGEPVGVPVDAEGLVVDRMPAGVRAVLVTPAHQFPSGVVLSSARRAALLERAHRDDAYLIEDDYDAEYRFDREPVGAVQGLDPERVAYAGSLSKSLAPALRIGWLVLPAALLDGVLGGRAGTDIAPPVIAQAALAELLTAGDLDRHLRRTRLAYRERRDVLAAAVAEHAPGLRLAGVPAGLHAVALLPAGADERAVADRAARLSVGVYPMSAYRLHPGGPPALVLGYAPLRPGDIREGVRLLGTVLA